MTLDVVSLFSGVGGIDLGFEAAGATTRLLCEFDKHAQAVLRHHYPTTPIHPDVTELTADDLHAAGARPGRTVLTAGFPCQDVSVAGARKGMGDGTRSGLYWHVDRLLGEFRPAWVVLENVPGLLSATCACRGDESCVRAGRQKRCGETQKGGWVSNVTHSVAGGGACVGGCIKVHGGVMGAVLGSLAGRGYGFAYRVLDAQRFGVPQRRRRVVIVGRLGDSGAAAAQVLLEPEGGSRDSSTGVATRQGTTAALGFGVGVSGELGGVANTLTARDAKGPLPDRSSGTVVMDEGTLSPTLTCELGEQSGQDGLAHAASGSLPVHEIVSTLQAGGGSRGYRVDAEAAGGGGASSRAHRRTVAALTANGVGTCGADDNQAQAGHIIATDTHTHTFQKVIRSGARDVNGDLPPEVWAEREVAATLSQFDLGSEARAVDIVVQPLAIRGRDGGAQIEMAAEGAPYNALRAGDGGSSRGQLVAVTTTLGDHTHTLTAEGHDASEDGTGRGTPVIAATLTAGVSRPGVNPPGRRQEDDQNLVTFEPKAGGDRTSSGSFEDGTGITPTVQGSRAPAVSTETTVRRLTPMECERLQGFPDNWTAETDNGPQADSHRYKQMGNAVAVPVFAWVARRLVAVDGDVS